MLRVRTLYASSAAETSRYYTRYLDEPDEEPGRWRGGEAAALGLADTVDTDQLEALLRGHDPATDDQLRRAEPAALDRYFDHDRVEAGSFPTLRVDIARRWIEHHGAGRSVAVVAETNAHVDALNLTIQAARRDLGHLGRSAAGIAGHEQASVGDHVVTRRNDRTLRTKQGQPVRNRDRWIVEGIGRDGSLTVTHQRGEGTVTLPADYVRENVRLGYAATAHGNQGDTVDIGLTVVTVATSHRSLYVGATRGRHENRLLVIADDLDEARDVLEQVLTNDRADVPAVVRRRELVEMVEMVDSRPSDSGRSAHVQPGRARGPKPDWEAKLDACRKARDEALERTRPFWDVVDQAQQDVYAANSNLGRLRDQHTNAGMFAKARLQAPLGEATEAAEAAATALELAVERAAPHEDAFYQADRAFEAARRIADIERFDRDVKAMQSRGAQRQAPGLGIG